MQKRVKNGVAAVLAVVGAVVVVSAQDGAAPERLGRCFTPVTTTGVYFEVTADGPTERVLRMIADAPRPTMTHSLVHVTALAHVRVPTTDQLLIEAEYPSMRSGRVHPPAIHAVRLRSQGATPALLTPQVVVDATPARAQRHESVLMLPAGSADTAAVDVVVVSDIGSTGCRLRLRHVRPPR